MDKHQSISATVFLHPCLETVSQISPCWIFACEFPARIILKRPFHIDTDFTFKRLEILFGNKRILPHTHCAWATGTCMGKRL